MEEFQQPAARLTPTRGKGEGAGRLPALAPARPGCSPQQLTPAARQEEVITESSAHRERSNYSLSG